MHFYFFLTFMIIIIIIIIIIKNSYYYYLILAWLAHCEKLISPLKANTSHESILSRLLQLLRRISTNFALIRNRYR